MAMVNKLSFFDAIDRATAGYDDGGIGTFSEKILHRTLKFYFEPDETKHEIEHHGAVADILGDGGVIEIQTRSLGKLKPKLDRFLSDTMVTVVHPIIETKRICRVDTETGESLPPRKSAKRGRASDALCEIGAIRQYLPNNNLTIILVFVDVIETRMLTGNKKVGRKKTQKLDCIPTSLNSTLVLQRREDYFALLPEDLPCEFSAAEFEKITKMKGIDSHTALMLLLKLGVLTRERVGRAYTYKINNI